MIIAYVRCNYTCRGVQLVHSLELLKIDSPIMVCVNSLQGVRRSLTTGHSAVTIAVTAENVAGTGCTTEAKVTPVTVWTVASYAFLAAVSGYGSYGDSEENNHGFQRNHSLFLSYTNSHFRSRLLLAHITVSLMPTSSTVCSCRSISGFI